MPRFTTHAPGTPSWVDLMCPDLDAAQAFYSSVFGWEIEDQFAPDGTRVYAMARLDGLAVAGMGSPPPGSPEMPAVWNSYVTVADVAASVAAAEAAGATVLMPPMQVFDSGHMAILADPSGAAFSMWQPVGHIGVEIGNEPDTYSWCELMTRDVASALSFYSEVFGWTYASGGMEGYHLIEGGTNDEGLGGIMEMPAEVPAEVPDYWGVYFTVTDLAATTSRVEAAGGQVVVPPISVPNVGTFSTLADPAGAAFNAMQPEAV